MRELRGLPASAGAVSGTWVRIGHPAPAAPVGTDRGREQGPPDEAGTIDARLDRLRAASAEAADELDRIATDLETGGHPDEAAIFLAQAAIARDPGLFGAAEARIRTGDDEVAAIEAAARAFAEQLRALPDELLAARAADVLDVGGRIGRRAAGVPDQPAVALDRPAIVVADDLPPSVTATLPRERLLGIALEGSSPTAHAAILARAYEIPAVVGVAGLLDALAGAPADAALAIDGTTGEVVVDPDQPTLRRLASLAEAARRGRDRDRAEALEPAVTRDGTAVTLLANIGTPDEAVPARELGARGVGLFRTEFLFLERSRPPTEDEQVEAYARVVEAFRPDPVTIRLLDVGGDKQIPYLSLAPEENPFLGVRALRLARTAPELFVTQLRACHRVAAMGPVKVMAPMVADARDVGLLLDLAAQARDALAAEGVGAGGPSLGVMLEIPSAILVANTYLGELGFASLGTNDLVQYTLAADRGNAALEPYRDPLHPAVLRLVRSSVEAAARHDVELSVCGEAGGDPVAALALIGLGIRSLSMVASSLAAVRRAIRGAEIRELEAHAIAALDDPSAAEVRSRFAALGAAPI